MNSKNSIPLNQVIPLLKLGTIPFRNTATPPPITSANSNTETKVITPHDSESGTNKLALASLTLILKPITTLELAHLAYVIIEGSIEDQPAFVLNSTLFNRGLVVTSALGTDGKSEDNFSPYIKQDQIVKYGSKTFTLGNTGASQERKRQEQLWHTLQSYLTYSTNGNRMPFPSDKDVICTVDSDEKKQELFFPYLINSRQLAYFHVDIPFPRDPSCSSSNINISSMVTCMCIPGIMAILYREGITIPVMQHNYPFSEQDRIKSVYRPNDLNLYYETTFADFDLKMQMLAALPSSSKQTKKSLHLHLPFFDYILFGFHLYFRGIMSSEVLRQFTYIVSEQKKFATLKLQQICRKYSNISLHCEAEHQSLATLFEQSLEHKAEQSESTTNTSTTASPLFSTSSSNSLSSPSSSSPLVLSSNSSSFLNSASSSSSGPSLSNSMLCFSPFPSYSSSPSTSSVSSSSCVTRCNLPPQSVSVIYSRQHNSAPTTPRRPLSASDSRSTSLPKSNSASNSPRSDIDIEHLLAKANECITWATKETLKKGKKGNEIEFKKEVGALAETHFVQWCKQILQADSHGVILQNHGATWQDIFLAADAIDATALTGKKQPCPEDQMSTEEKGELHRLTMEANDAKEQAAKRAQDLAEAIATSMSVNTKQQIALSAEEKNATVTLSQLQTGEQITPRSTTPPSTSPLSPQRNITGQRSPLKTEEQITPRSTTPPSTSPLSPRRNITGQRSPLNKKSTNPNVLQRQSNEANIRAERAAKKLAEYKEGLANKAFNIEWLLHLSNIFLSFLAAKEDAVTSQATSTDSYVLTLFPETEWPIEAQLKKNYAALLTTSRGTHVPHEYLPFLCMRQLESVVHYQPQMRKPEKPSLYYTYAPTLAKLVKSGLVEKCRTQAAVKFLSDQANNVKESTVEATTSTDSKTSTEVTASLAITPRFY